MGGERLAEKRAFLFLAVAMGAAGVVMGGVTIWFMAGDLLRP